MRHRRGHELTSRNRTPGLVTTASVAMGGLMPAAPRPTGKASAAAARNAGCSPGAHPCRRHGKTGTCSLKPHISPATAARQAPQPALRLRWARLWAQWPTGWHAAGCKRPRPGKAKRAVRACQTGHIAVPYGLFCGAKWHKQLFNINRYYLPCRLPLYLCRHIACPFGPHAKVSSIA